MQVCVQCGGHSVFYAEFRTDYAEARTFYPVNVGVEYTRWLDETPYRMSGNYCADCHSFVSTREEQVPVAVPDGLELDSVYGDHFIICDMTFRELQDLDAFMNEQKWRELILYNCTFPSDHDGTVMLLIEQGICDDDKWIAGIIPLFTMRYGETRIIHQVDWVAPK